MDNSEQTPYNRHGLKLYCKRDHDNPIQYPKPDSRKNIVKSNFSSTGSVGSRKNGKHNDRTKKQQFWKYDDRHIDQYDLSEFHPECEFAHESTWHPTTYWIDDWWLDCKCDRCKGCMCPNLYHTCVKLTTCYCREPAYLPYSNDEDDYNDYDSRPRQKYSYGDDDNEIFNSCWGCYRKTCLDCNPPPIDECGDPCCPECYGPYRNSSYY